MKKIILLFCLLFLAFPLYADSNVPPTAITGLNQFAFNLYQQLSTENADTNTAVSPFGISSLLNILYVGSKGSTQQEIGNALGITQQTAPLDIKSLTNSFVSSQDLSGSDNSQFIYGNALWLQSGTQLNPSFTQQLNNFNSGKVYDVDYIKHPNSAVDQINTWVAKLTNNYIKQLISLDMIDENTRVILTNAIYFKGLWQHAFNPTSTQPGNFTLDNGSVISVPMMSQSHAFSYAENDTIKMLVLPYKNSNLVMAILLPKQAGNFKQFSQSLSLDTLNQLSAKTYTVDEMNVTLPKFIIQSTMGNIENNLKTLGIKQAFTPLADFTAMTNQSLLVSKVIQKVYVGVDEKGTIAAAATGVSMMAMSAMPMTFKADHPFAFLIYDKQSNLILFMGNVMNPAQQ